MSNKLLIIDDDPVFAMLLAKVAKARGFAAESHASLVELGSFARVREFDIAIIDYFLGSIRGDEIAEYVDTFFSNVPVIIASAQNFSQDEVDRWPAPVRRFVPKTEGADAIIDAADEVLSRERFLKRLADRPGSPGPESKAP